MTSRFLTWQPALAVAVALGAFALTVRAGEGNWISLFDGQSLQGWRASENTNSFTVQDGLIVADGPRSHLFYVGLDGAAGFTNFEFSADVRSRPGANSGIYFHTDYQASGWPGQGFEVQINNTQPKHDNYYEFKKTGSLYGVRNLYKSIVRDDAWFTMNIRVSGPRVQVRLDDTLVVDYVEPAAGPGIDGGSRRLAHGTFALQGHDAASKVCFKNLRVRPLPAAVAPADAGDRPVVDDYYRQVLQFNAQNFPLINFHAHLKGGLTLPEALAQARQSGVNFGIAVNCGLGFSITNDAGIEAFLKTMQGQPAFVGMQAEGREWRKLFSPAAVSRFDYIFTDAMTFFDREGRRTRLWLKDEVTVGDKQAFMDMLVARTLTILNEEPIDIYVNPTFLPEVIAAEYDQLWTPERMQPVIAAAVQHGVAIEINSRYRIPSLAFLKLAKKAGAKFSFGTNNTGAEVGRVDYCLEVAKALNLTADDMFMPKPPGRRPIQLRN